MTGPLLQVLDAEGALVGPDPKLPADDLRRLFRHMLEMRVLDTRMLSLQRQGRIGFYGTATGQEAAVTGSAYAWREGDWVFPALREMGVALWRGTTVQEPEVTIEWGDFLLHPARERVTARRDHFESVLCGQIHDQSSQPDQFGPGLGRGPADLGADLDHGLMELRFDLAEDHRILFQDLGDVRAEFPGRRVDDLILFFDPDR